MATQRCGFCGNTIPVWANGICYRCVQIEKDSKRYGQRLRPIIRKNTLVNKKKKTHHTPQKRKQAPYAPQKRKQAPYAPQKRKQAPYAPQKQRVNLQLQETKRAQSRLVSCLEGFNRLLKDIYGRNIWLGELLEIQGVSREQVRGWRQNVSWLLNFLTILEQELMSSLAKSVPEQNPHVLSYWYDLNNTKVQSVEGIAQRLGITKEEVIVAHNMLLRHLREKESRIMLEKIVAKTAIENS